MRIVLIAQFSWPGVNLLSMLIVWMLAPAYITTATATTKGPLMTANLSSATEAEERGGELPTFEFDHAVFVVRMKAEAGKTIWVFGRRFMFLATG